MARLDLRRGTSSIYPILFKARGRELTVGKQVVKPDSKGQAELLTPLGHINIHIRSGSIILIHDKPGYTLKETRASGYGLIIHLDAEGKAAGEAVLDDGMSIEGKSPFYPSLFSLIISWGTAPEWRRH